MKTKTRNALIAMLLGVSSASTSQAVLLSYFIDGSDNDLVALSAQKASPITGLTVSSLVLGGDLADDNKNVITGVAPNITITEFATAGNLTPAGPTAGSLAGSQWLAARSNLVNGSSSPTPAPLSTSDYFGFTVTPTAGYTLNLSSFKFDYALINSGNASSTTGIAALFVSVGGGPFTNRGQQSITLTSASGASPVSIVTVDLTSLGAISQAVEFRLALSDNRGVTVSSHLLQGLQLEGTVTSPIPEPSTFAALAGVAVLGLAASRRRRL